MFDKMDECGTVCDWQPIKIGILKMVILKHLNPEFKLRLRVWKLLEISGKM
jgi:hypothetical protein